MAYVAVSGGEAAIAASLELLRRQLADPTSAIPLKTIAAALPELVDQVMGESSLYEPNLAALALKQGGGSVEEAVFLLRAFRSTLERPYISRIIETSAMRTSRRISAAFKDIPGGQILGATRDYSHRLLDFSLTEGVTEVRQGDGSFGAQSGAQRDGSFVLFKKSTKEPSLCAPLCAPLCLIPSHGYEALPKVAAYLSDQGLLTMPAHDDTPPRDITMEALSFPTTRSIRLQALSRGMTQAVMALGYAAIRGFGPTHPTVGELRCGSLDILIDHPFQAGGEDDAYYVGSIMVTEVESLFSVESAPEPNGQGDHALEFGIGYGLVYGRAESKAIAMSVLDFCLSLGDPAYPTQDEEFVLYHIDGVEATGFISHLKLPHYVTFQSKLSSARRTQDAPHPEPLTPAHTEGDIHAATV